MSEKAWIARYFAPLVNSAGADRLRDDVARLTAQGNMIVTTDALVEGVHFLSSDPIETIAEKLVRVNVSDCIAKGALPHEALLTLGWPHTRGEAEVRLFAEVLGEALKFFGVRLIGGDTSVVPHGLFVSLTLTAACLSAGPVRRSGARAGDDVWVTGEIGAAKLGFDALKRGDAQLPFVSAYRVPRLPPLGMARLIAAHAHASMDVSDGLLIDAQTLAGASSAAVHLALDTVPFAGSPGSLSERLALASWGDDYQCLFTAPPAAAPALAVDAAEIGARITRIGRVVAGAGLFLTENGQSINLPETLGFDHGRQKP